MRGGGAGQHVLERVWLGGNPVCGHEFMRAAVLLAAGPALLRIDDRGIEPQLREQAPVPMHT